MFQSEGLLSVIFGGIKKLFDAITGSIKSIVYSIIACIVVFGIGYLFGMHHMAVAAAVKKEAISEASDGCWLRKLW